MADGVTVWQRQLEVGNSQSFSPGKILFFFYFHHEHGRFYYSNLIGDGEDGCDCASTITDAGGRRLQIQIQQR